MYRTCVHCGEDFDADSPRAAKARAEKNARVIECPDCLGYYEPRVSPPPPVPTAVYIPPWDDGVGLLDEYPAPDERACRHVAADISRRTGMYVYCWPRMQCVRVETPKGFGYLGRWDWDGRVLRRRR